MLTKHRVQRRVIALIGVSLMLLSGCAAPLPAADAPAYRIIYLVRHAEKLGASDDPGLTARGQRRALALALRLETAGIQSIYSTAFQRTRETAAPVARKLGLEIEPYDHHNLEAFAKQLRASSGSTLVVGHSNTTHSLVTLLGGDPGAPIREADEYDRLYLVVSDPNGAVETTLQRYGNQFSKPKCADPTP